MVRTQIQLTEDQAERLRQVAQRRGCSMAQVIRESIDRTLATEPALTRAEKLELVMSVAGKFPSGLGDLAERHDDYVVEAILEDWPS